jgi:tetratricopeptide (TPR) repeat protein
LTSRCLDHLTNAQAVSALEGVDLPALGSRGRQDTHHVHDTTAGTIVNAAALTRQRPRLGLFFAVLGENSAAGRKRVADALTALHRYSLATVDGNRISVHRLLQKVIRDRLDGPDQVSAVTHALTAIQRALPGDPALPGTWPQWQELVPHVAALASIEAVARLSAAQLVATLNWTCDFLSRAGSSLPALELATQAVSVSTGHLGPEHPATLIARGNLAESYRSAGRTGEAIAIEEQLVPDAERLLGPDHPATLTARGNLAASYWSAGRTGEAIAIFERVAADCERLLGPEHPDTLIARGNLAESYRSAGRTGEAITLQEQLVPDTERLLGPDHPTTLTARANGRPREPFRLSERLTVPVTGTVSALRQVLLFPVGMMLAARSCVAGESASRGRSGTAAHPRGRHSSGASARAASAGKRPPRRGPRHGTPRNRRRCVLPASRYPAQSCRVPWRAAIRGDMARVRLAVHGSRRPVCAVEFPAGEPARLSGQLAHAGVVGFAQLPGVPCDRRRGGRCPADAACYCSCYKRCVWSGRI